MSHLVVQQPEVGKSRNLWGKIGTGSKWFGHPFSWTDPYSVSWHQDWTVFFLCNILVGLRSLGGERGGRYRHDLNNHVNRKIVFKKGFPRPQSWKLSRWTFREFSFRYFLVVDCRCLKQPLLGFLENPEVHNPFVFFLCDFLLLLWLGRQNHSSPFLLLPRYVDESDFLSDLLPQVPGILFLMVSWRLQCFSDFLNYFG